MSNEKLSIWVLGFLTLIICSFFYFRSNRYAISKVKGNISYKIDRWTGDTWVLTGNREIKVEKDEEETEKEVTKKVAIEKVKKAKTLDDDYPAMENHSFIEYDFRSLKGNLKILGWQAEKVDSQTYFVLYKYEHLDKTKGYYFELNTKANVIRNVLSDFDLMKKYKVGLFAPRKDGDEITPEEFLKRKGRSPEKAFN